MHPERPTGLAPAAPTTEALQWAIFNSAMFCRIAMRVHAGQRPGAGVVGIRLAAFLGESGIDAQQGWDEAERDVLRAHIAAREHFVELLFSRLNPDGSTRRFRMSPPGRPKGEFRRAKHEDTPVSGEPIFNEACRFPGYRGIGSEIIATARPAARCA